MPDWLFAAIWIGLVSPVVAFAACNEVIPSESTACPPCEWPAGRDMVDPRTGEKGVFLTQDEWQLLWDCEAERRK